MVKVRNLQYHFDKKSGYLTKVVNSKSVFSLEGGLTLAEATIKLKQLKQFKERNNQIVETTYDGVKWFKVRWTFVPDMPARLDYQYQYNKEINVAGITFNYLEE